MPGRTRHHLVPRSEGGSRLPTAFLCLTCHHQLHVLFDNRTLAALDTIPKLRRHPRVAAYLDWIRKRPGATADRVRRTRRRG